MKNRILIVVDMQNDFIYGPLGTKEAIEILPNVKEKIENYDGYIIYTKDTHDSDYLNTYEGENLPIVHCQINTDGWNITDKIPFTPKTDGRYLKDVYLKKTFGAKEMVEDILKLSEDSKPDEIELIGVCTDICVITNALSLKTYLPEVKIKVDKSCCSGVTPELHDAALKTMASCQIELTGD